MSRHRDDECFRRQPNAAEAWRVMYMSWFKYSELRRIHGLGCGIGRWLAGPRLALLRLVYRLHHPRAALKNLPPASLDLKAQGARLTAAGRHGLSGCAARRFVRFFPSELTVCRKYMMSKMYCVLESHRPWLVHVAQAFSWPLLFSHPPSAHS